MVALVRRSWNNLIFRQRGLLVRATDTSQAAFDVCCCGATPGDGGTPCCCPMFLAAPPVASVTLTVDAPDCPEIDGATTLLTLTVGDGCVTYSVSTWTIGTCGSSVQVNFILRCPTDGESAQDMLINFLPQSSGCDATGISDVEAEDGATCDPLSIRFEGFILRDGFGVSGECECCPDGFAVVITP